MQAETAVALPRSQNETSLVPITRQLTKPKIKQYMNVVGPLLIQILEHSYGYELAQCIQSKINYILRIQQVNNLAQNIQGADEGINNQVLLELLQLIASDLKLIIDDQLVDFVVEKHYEKELFPINKIEQFKNSVVKDLVEKFDLSEKLAHRIIRLIFGYNEY